MEGNPFPWKALWNGFMSRKACVCVCVFLWRSPSTLASVSAWVFCKASGSSVGLRLRNRNVLEEICLCFCRDIALCRVTVCRSSEAGLEKQRRAVEERGLGFWRPAAPEMSRILWGVMWTLRRALNSLRLSRKIWESSKHLCYRNILACLDHFILFYAGFLEALKLVYFIDTDRKNPDYISEVADGYNCKEGN